MQSKHQGGLKQCVSQRNGTFVSSMRKNLTQRKSQVKENKRKAREEEIIFFPPNSLKKKNNEDIDTDTEIKCELSVCRDVFIKYRRCWISSNVCFCLFVCFFYYPVQPSNRLQLVFAVIISQQPGQMFGVFILTYYQKRFAKTPKENYIRVLQMENLSLKGSKGTEPHQPGFMEGYSI